MKRIFYILFVLINLNCFSQEIGNTGLCATSNEYKNISVDYGKQKAWMVTVISSYEYLIRLVGEFNGDIRGAIIEYCTRTLRIKTKYIIDDGGEINKKITGAGAYYDFTSVHLPTHYGGATMGIHEFEHQVTIGDFYMTDYAKNLYRMAFDSSKVNDKTRMFNRTQLNYYSDPIELDAQKKQLEYEMERLGIKTYGESFTKRHYKMLLYCLSKGLFTNQGATDFMLRIKPEYIYKIMNTIA